MDAGVVYRDRKSVSDVPAFDRRAEGRHVQTASGPLSMDARALVLWPCALDGLRRQEPIIRKPIARGD